MSYTVKSGKVYASINDLPQDYSIKNGDKLIIQRDDETYIVDYSNVIVDIEHVSFGETFNEMVNFTSNCTSFMNEINDSFSDLSATVEDISSKHKEIIGRLDAIEAILKLVYCSNSAKQETNLVESLDDTAKAEFERMKSSISSLYSDANGGEEFEFYENSFSMSVIS